MSEKLNTHYYDGMLTQRFEKLQEIIPASEVPSLQQTRKEILHHLQTHQKDFQFSALEIKFLCSILHSLFIQHPQNYDIKNEIHVHTLLPLVWYQVKEYDLSAQKLFYQQVLEIRNGPCAQGRTARLLQCTTL